MRAVIAITIVSVFSILVLKYFDNTLGSGVPLATVATASDL